MAGYNNFYGGSAYGMKPEYGNPISNYTPAGNIIMGLDARTANQLREVSNKLNTGAKGAEVQMAFPQVAESIPDEHLKELDRLRKLVGVELTLHGPLIDPTGFTGEGNWDSRKREQAERQMWDAVKRATKINSEGNVIVTFHSSNGLPEPETRFWDKKANEGKGGQVVTNIAVVDERTGQIGQLPPTSKEYLLEEANKTYETQKKSRAEIELDKKNRDMWLDSLSGLNLELQRAKEVLDVSFSNRALTKEGRIVRMEDEEEKEAALSLYKAHKQGKPEEFKKAMETLQEHPDFKEKEDKKALERNVKEQIENLERANIYIHHSFNQFKELYNRAYQAAEKNDEGQKKEDIRKLNEIKEKITNAIDTKTEYLKDPSQLINFADTLTESIQKMSLISEPKIFRPLKEFGIEKSAETFSNIALNAYKEFGSKAPIISIENPPAGMGMSRAEELKELIEKSREELAKKLSKEENLGEDEAKRQAEKLIGATWDVGHINMLRKYGYGDEQLKEQTKEISPFVKHIHLSDNFGYEHTELPMGMGNVPMKEHIEELKKAQKEKFEKIKQVVEAAQWFQHFQTNPFSETLANIGSPIYSMKMAPYWNQASQNFGGYFAGYGMNPEMHHSLYGAGFSNLPPELGGQMAGKSRLSGAPIE